MSQEELSLYVRFVAQLIFSALVSYMAWIMAKVARYDRTFGSTVLAIFFLSIVLFLWPSTITAFLAAAYPAHRAIWIPPVTWVATGALVASSLLIILIIMSKDNLKISTISRFLASPESYIRAELDQSNREKEDLQRLLADEHHFLRAAAHDLRAPLRSIGGFIDLIVEEGPKPEYVEFIGKALEKMTALIDDLSILGRIETEQLPHSWIDMNELVEEVASLFNGQASMIEIDPALPRVCGVRLRIFQLMQNLISNALKFDSTRVKVCGTVTSKSVLISVIDNGIGIAPEYHQKIFEQFQRLNLEEEYPGTGIGLTICQKIVGQHKGKIWVDSKPGEGSTFNVLLPYVKESYECTSGRG